MWLHELERARAIADTHTPIQIGTMWRWCETVKEKAIYHLAYQLQFEDREGDPNVNVRRFRHRNHDNQTTN